MFKRQPRIAITPTKELEEALKRFTEASGMPAATLCRNLLTEAVPAIDALTKAYLEHSKDPAKAFEIMQEVLFSTEELTEDLKKEVQQELDHLND